MKRLTAARRFEEVADMADRVVTLVENFAIDMCHENGVDPKYATTIAWTGVRLALKELKQRTKEKG